MTEWYIQRNSDGPYPLQLRFGGCEYSLTEAEFSLFAEAVYKIRSGIINYAESEAYADLCYAGPKVDLREILNLPKFRRF